MINGEFQITLKLILWDKNFFLYLKVRFTNSGDLPGGRISKEEHYNWTEALKREIKEELGNIEYKISTYPVFCFPHFVSKDKKDSVAILYEGIYLNGNIQLSAEHTEYRWIHKKENLEHYFSDTMLTGLKNYFEFKKQNEKL